MELRHLRYFVAVAEELHFTRAAQRLHIAQPPLSQQIRQLETELGVQLFERSRHGVRLTDPGLVFLDRARRTLEAADDAVWSVQRSGLGEVGRLIVGFSGSAVPVLSDVIAAHRQRYPGVHVVLRELGSSAQIQHLLDRQLHVGLVREHPADDRIRMEVLRTEPLVAVLPAAHRLARQRKIALRDLAGESWVLAPRAQSSSYTEAVLAACAEAGFQPQVAQESSETLAIVSLVAAGLGVTLLPAGAETLRPRGVVFRTLVAPGATLELAVAWLRDETSPLVVSFLETCRKKAVQPRRRSAS